MKTNTRKKEFDCVKMMRDIREKLRKEYEENPELRQKRLKEIHKKWNFEVV